jgi:hypothetical protein
VRRKERRARLVTLTMLSLITLLLLLGVGFALTQTIPSEPLRVYSAKVITSEACPGGPVRIMLDYEILEGYYISEIEIESVWIPVGNDTTAPETGGTHRLRNPEPVKRTTRVGSAVRSAPLDAGTYRLETEYNVVYHFHGIPRFQRVLVKADGELSVLPACKEMP